MKRDIEQLQQALLAANDERTAMMVAAPSSEITVYPAPFLRRSRIYRVLYYNPYKPLLLYLGFVPDVPVYFLAGNPPAYHEFVQADGVDLVTLDSAINYVTVFLEVTRNMYELVYQVTSVDQIRFLPQPSPEQKQAQEALTQKYQQILAAPSGETTADGYTITAHVMRQQKLERHTCKIRRNGDIEVQITMLEEGMPTVIGI